MLLTSLCFLSSSVSAKIPFPLEIRGFVEGGYGRRYRNDPYEKDASLSESRLQLDLSKNEALYSFIFRSDLYYDDVLTTSKWHIREANVLLYPLDTLDLKIGRQILTWGAGDLLFINDLFPKDWQSFFIGRSDEYLKAPSDAIKISLYPEMGSFDLVFTPRFDPSIYIRGERISYYNPLQGRIAGQDAILGAKEPDEWFSDFELAARFKRYIGSYELSLYGYYGFWKTPAGMNPETMNPAFPPLSVYGASIQGNLLKGIGKLEIGYYESLDDEKGFNPFVDNSQLRSLLGYEKSLWRDFTFSLQYYLERILDYNNYESSAKAMNPDTDPDTLKDENRHVFTLRITQLLLRQNLTLSFFTYYSPSDEDVYARPNVSYKITDKWLVVLGANIFGGEKDHTFFGQFENNSNIYGRIRYYI